MRERHFGFAIAVVVASFCGCKRGDSARESSDDDGWGEIRAQIRPEARSAFETILKADQFETSGIGIGSTLSSNAAAVRTLIRDPAARTIFEALSEGGAPVSRLYALAALWYLRPSDYPARMAAVRDRFGQDTVRTMRGCLGGTQTVEAVLGMDVQHLVRLAPGTDLYHYKCPTPRDTGRIDFASGTLPIDIVEGEATDATCAQSRTGPEFVQPRP